MSAALRIRLWTSIIPVLALGVLVVALTVSVGTPLAVLCGAALIGAVLVAVHHAEVIAHRVGEPLGTLVLALAVTAIEAALILSMMIAGGEDMAALPRDSIYAAVMIICNGVVGLCVLLGGLAHREQTFRVEGAGAGLAALIVMATLTLVLPVFTTTTPGGHLQHSQLAFRRDDFGRALGDLRLRSDRASSRLFHSRDRGGQPGRACRAADGPRGLDELRVAAGLAGVGRRAGQDALAHDRAGRRGGRTRPGPWSGSSSPRSSCCRKRGPPCAPPGPNRLQSSMNLAIGSALACIGLTVPVVVLASVVLGLPLVLGLEPKDMAMLAVTFLVSTVTLGTGRTYVMQGAVHLVLFAAFLFLAFVP